ncbi:hypothetical protein ACFQT0_27515 [Hymenobacter humi]|uniref:Uncharacterized protein n=1 Tax=Hymenobacter humi TaxID=1411620 RepID=A0ABW2UB07_9BACT
MTPIRTTLDDELRHVPAAAALGLSLAGVKGKHSTVNQALLFALTYTINNTLTSNLKTSPASSGPGTTATSALFPANIPAPPLPRPGFWTVSTEKPATGTAWGLFRGHKRGRASPD